LSLARHRWSVPRSASEVIPAIANSMRSIPTIGRRLHYLPQKDFWIWTSTIFVDGRGKLQARKVHKILGLGLWKIGYGLLGGLCGLNKQILVAMVTSLEQSLPVHICDQPTRACCLFHAHGQPTVTGVLLLVDQSRGTVYLWHCVQVMSWGRLSKDIWRHFCLTILTVIDSYRDIDSYVTILPSLPT